jgi:regulator of PEP synthase PpsR (kinase-PPPase family)
VRKPEAGLRESARATAPAPIYVVSGGVGASGEQLVQTVLAQFPAHAAPVIVRANVRQVEQVERLVSEAEQTSATIVHTLVDARLRQALMELARRRGVVAIDLMGPLLSRLATVLGCEPLGQPGLYRQLHRPYFERVAAIEYTLAHDDGQHPEGWPAAEVILLGVSRTGKTPLSVYLSVLGWKVANCPILPDVPVPPALSQLDSGRVVGLTIDPDQLVMFRRQRFSRLGAPGSSAYVDPDAIRAEIEGALRFFRQQGFYVIDVTDKTIEASADDVLKRIRLPERPAAAQLR